MRGISTGKLAACLAFASASAAWAGPDWVEDDHGDAGSTTGGSQDTNGTSGVPLTRIHGRLTGVTPLTGLGDTEDVYTIFIDDPANFNATTINCGVTCDPDCGGCAEFNTSLWLFETDGTGLLGNLVHFKIGVDLGKPPSGTEGDSELDNAACDETDVEITKPGLYLLAITHFRNPTNADGPIFAFDDSGNGCDFGEDSGPDGPGGGSPFTGWFSTDDSDTEGLGAEYIIFMEGVRPAIIEAPMGMDIKPGGCPNPFNRNSNGVLPVTLCGGEDDLSIDNVVLASVRMSRPDGMGGYIGSLAPNEGPPGPHSTYGDQATPYTGIFGGCHTLGGDGINDLNMKFNSQDIVEDLEMDDLLPGALVEIVLRGELSGGPNFIARDWVRLVPPGTPPGMLTVRSNVGRSWINTSPLDLNLDGGGFGTVFQRTYPLTTVVTLDPQPVHGMVFKGWRINNKSLANASQTLNVAISGANVTVDAIFEPVSASNGTTPN